MMSVSLDTKIQIVILMWKFESPIAVIRELQRQGVSEIPEGHTLSRIYQKFLRTGSVEDVKIKEVEGALVTITMNTVRNIARERNISKNQSHRIMPNIIGFKPYMMHHIQQLVDEDTDLRVEMCERLIPLVEDEQNNGNIFFSDESTSYLSGFVNKENCRLWAPTNPYAIIEAAMHSAKINVWCAMSKTSIIGPYFFLKMR